MSTISTSSSKLLMKMLNSPGFMTNICRKHILQKPILEQSYNLITESKGTCHGLPWCSPSVLVKTTRFRFHACKSTMISRPWEKGENFFPPNAGAASSPNLLILIYWGGFEGGGEKSVETFDSWGGTLLLFICCASWLRPGHLLLVAMSRICLLGTLFLAACFFFP